MRGVTDLSERFRGVRPHVPDRIAQRGLHERRRSAVRDRPERPRRGRPHVRIGIQERVAERAAGAALFHLTEDSRGPEARFRLPVAQRADQERAGPRPHLDADGRDSRRHRLLVPTQLRYQRLLGGLEPHLAEGARRHDPDVGVLVLQSLEERRHRRGHLELAEDAEGVRTCPLERALHVPKEPREDSLLLERTDHVQARRQLELADLFRGELRQAA